MDKAEIVETMGRALQRNAFPPDVLGEEDAAPAGQDGEHLIGQGGQP